MTTEADTEPHSLAGLLGLFVAIRRRFWVVLLCAIVAPAAAVAYSLHQQKIYTASASLLFRNPQFDQQLLGGNAFQPTQDAAVEQATNIQLVELPVVAAHTAAALHRGLTPAGVASDISVGSNGQSNVGTVSASNPDPRLAADLANTYAEQFSKFRRDADRAKIESAISLIQQEINSLPNAKASAAQSQTLRRNVSQLQVLAALQTGNAEVVQTAQPPTSPSSPKPVVNGALGLIAGLLLGVGLALLLDRLDRRLKDPEAIGRAFNRPILATIPRSSAIERFAGSKDQDRIGLDRLRPLDAEAFRILRVSLRYFNAERPVTSVLVTSAAQGDGKSTVSMHLAMAAAEAGISTLLLEADLRHPTIARQLKISEQTGLSLVLAGETDLASAIVRVPLIADETHPAFRSLDVLIGGPVPPNPSDLIDSRRMRDVIAQATRDYELVVVDTPPTPVVSDAIPLITEVSGVVAVARVDKTTRDSAARLRTQLENLGAPLLGVVVNSVRREGTLGYYGDRDYSYFTPASTGGPRPGVAEPLTDHDSGEESEEQPLAGVPTSGDVTDGAASLDANGRASATTSSTASEADQAAPLRWRRGRRSRS